VSTATPSYRGHRYPVEIINHCLWLYFRFPLSFREVEELMLARGVAVSYETIRRWCAKFGQAYANQLRRRRPRPGDKWHLDEVFIRINGRLRYLWRAVDQHWAATRSLTVSSCRRWSLIFSVSPARLGRGYRDIGVFAT
jgi:putative transposase